MVNTEWVGTLMNNASLHLTLYPRKAASICVASWSVLAFHCASRMTYGYSNCITLKEIKTQKTLGLKSHISKWLSHHGNPDDHGFWITLLRVNNAIIDDWYQTQMFWGTWKNWVWLVKSRTPGWKRMWVSINKVALKSWSRALYHFNLVSLLRAFSPCLTCKMATAVSNDKILKCFYLFESIWNYVAHVSLELRNPICPCLPPPGLGACASVPGNMWFLYGRPTIPHWFGAIE